MQKINIQKDNLEESAWRWVTAKSDLVATPSNFYCETRDVFQARLDFLAQFLLKNNIQEGDAYIVSAIAGEIGNNSFDHNLGNWPDIMGIFFAYQISSGEVEIFLADRGVGILKTLKKVRPDLKTNADALQVAFTEKISGRSPENRGNGLKFVKESVKDKRMNLIFISGNAQAELNYKMSVKEIDKNIRGCLAILKYKR